jgi:hypothetical protein
MNVPVGRLAMNTAPFTIYVGMALSDAPEEFRTDFQQELKAGLRKLAGVEVLDFFWTSHGPDVGDDVDVYELDEKYAQNADLFVAIFDHPSTGLGMEVMIRHPTGKPSLFFARKGKKVTRMVTGYLRKFAKSLHRYEHVSTIVEIVWSYILNHRSDLLDVVMGSP